MLGLKYDNNGIFPYFRKTSLWLNLKNLPLEIYIQYMLNIYVEHISNVLLIINIIFSKIFIFSMKTQLQILINGQIR